MDDLGTNGNGRVHQFAVVVIEIILEFNAISIDKLNGLVTLFVVVGVNNESEISRLNLGFIEHPFVEKQILIAGGRHHKSDGTALGTRNGFARLINGLMEFVCTFHHTVGFITYSKIAL